MASGTIVGGTSKYHTCVVKWSSSAGTGGSTVTATVYNRVSGRWRYNAGRPCSVTIEGSTVNGSLPRVYNSAGDYAGASHSRWIGYTGNRNITISGMTDLSTITYNKDGSKVGVRTCSAVVGLDRVGEKPPSVSFTSPSAHTMSENGGTINLSWNRCYDYSGSARYGIQVSINGGGWARWKYDIPNGTTSTTYSVPAGQGNTYQFAIECYNDVGYSGFGFSNKVTTNKLTSPTIGDLGVFNPYVNQILNIPLTGGSQLNGGTFTRKAAIYVDNVAKYKSSAAASSTNSIKITVDPDEIAKILGTRSYSNSSRFKVVAWTENSNGTKSSTVSKTFTVNINTDGGATPTLETPILSGGILDNPSTCFISGLTPLTVTSGKATLRRAPTGTTLSYDITCTGTYSNVTENKVTYDWLSAGVKTITVKVTDSRGLSTSITTKCMIQDYAPPVIKTINGERLDNPKTSGKVTYTLTYSPIYQYKSPTVPGTQLNNITVQQLSRDGGTKYVNYATGTEITSLNTELAYEMILRIADKVQPTKFITKKTNIPTAKSGLSIRKNGVGIQCVPQDGYALNVVGKSWLDGATYIDGSLTVRDSCLHIRSGDTSASSYMITFGKKDENYYSGLYLNATRELCVGLYDNGKYQDILMKFGSDSIVTTKKSEIGSARIINDLWVGNTWSSGKDGITGVNVNKTGVIELSGNNPCIDFHYNDSAANYTGRIACDNEYGLSIIGSTWVGNFYLPASEYLGFYDEKNGTRYAWLGRNGSTKTNFYLTAQDNVTQFYFNQSISCTTLTQRSDRKFKDNIKPIEKSKDFIMGLDPVEFNFKDGKRKHLGFIAQDVAALSDEIDMGDLSLYQAEIVDHETGLPEKHYDKKAKEEDLQWSLNYSEIIAPLVAVVQEQQKEINELKMIIKGE